MKFPFWLLVVFLAGFAWPQAHAQSNLPSSQCGKQLDGNCAEGVAAGGIYYAAKGAEALSALVRQSGQRPYALDANWNRACVEYGCGPNRPDDRMKAASTVTAGQVNPGCLAYNRNTGVLQCNIACAAPGDRVTIDGLLLDDIILTVNNTKACKVRLSNSTIRGGLNLCMRGTAQIFWIGPVVDIEMYNNRFINDGTCHPNAELWGTPAAAGAGLTQNASFTGTMTADGLYAPGILTLAPGVTGTVSRGQYVDWPGRIIRACCTLPGSEGAQIVGIVQWMGTVTTSGGTINIVSTDPASPNPAPSANTWMGWGNSLNNTRSRAGIYVASCDAGAKSCTAGVAANLLAPTKVAFWTQSCTGAACDNAKALISCAQGTVVRSVGACVAQVPANSGKPLPMTTGPRSGGGPSMSTSGPPSTMRCNGYKSRFNIARTGNIFVTSLPCPVDVQSDFLEMTSGAIGYADNGENRGFVGHLNGFISQQPYTCEQNPIERYRLKYNTVFVNRYNANGSITAPLTNFVNRSQTDCQTTFRETEISNNMAVGNLTVNNGFMDGTAKFSPGAYHIRQLGQNVNTVAAVSANMSENRDGTGTLHITAVNSGRPPKLNDFLICAPACADTWRGAPKLIEELPTASGDVSTWKTNYYRSIGGRTLIKTYVPTILDAKIQDNLFDITGFSGPMLLEATTPFLSHTCSGNKLVDGSAVAC